MSGDDRSAAHSRAQADFDRYSEFAKLSCQLTFAANGGAALAMLSFVTAILTDETAAGDVEKTKVLQSFATSAAMYLTGIFFILIATIFFAASQQLWGGYWEDEAKGKPTDAESRLEFRAFWCERFGFASFAFGVVLFPIGSSFAVSGLI